MDNFGQCLISISARVTVPGSQANDAKAHRRTADMPVHPVPMTADLIPSPPLPAEAPVHSRRVTGPALERALEGGSVGEPELCAQLRK